MNTTYFTTKVATDNTFCNRQQEKQSLINSLEKNQHLVVVAPRRYGKTSLVEHTLTQQKFLYARVDLFCVVYEEDVCRKLAKGISKLLREMMSFSENTFRLLEQCFKISSIGIKAGNIEIKAEFEKPNSALAQLEDLLEGIEKVAQKKKLPVAIFFDEFQDVLKIDETNKIQAAIRAVAQHSKYVTYIFSGSSRILLNKIFDDKKQPLYMLCKKMLLSRIEHEHFKKHINHATKNKWKPAPAEEIISSILKLTECHPFYVNLLCDKIWELNKTPSLADVNNCWEQALNENKGKVIADLEPLNANRIKVLTTIALLNNVNEPNSKVFLDKVKLPLSSTQNAVKYLLNYDYIHETPEGLMLVDPLMKKFIVEHIYQ